MTKLIFTITMLLLISSITLYLTFGHGLENIGWLKKQYHHQQLVEKFNQLGSVDEIIERIQRRLQDNPNDAQGYYLLGKLYQLQGKEQEAQQAFKAMQNAS